MNTGASAAPKKGVSSQEEVAPVEEDSALTKYNGEGVEEEVQVAAVSRPCEIEFNDSLSCASLSWEKTPTLSQPWNFGLVTWNKGMTAGFLLDPEVKAEVFVRMSCCKTLVKDFQRVEVSSGELQFGSVKFFTEGNFEIFIQFVKDGEIVNEHLSEPFYVGR